MKLLSVRLSDTEHGYLKDHADRLGVNVSTLVKMWIGSFGGGEVVPNGDRPSGRSTGGSSAASPPPPAPEVCGEGGRCILAKGHLDGHRQWAEPEPPGSNHAVTLMPDGTLIDPVLDQRAAPLPEFLAAPVDDCPVCGHDRQASSHLGGQPCKFKLGRRNCACTFEGF